MHFESTNSFPLLLGDAGVSIAVSTYQANKLLILQNQNGNLDMTSLEMDKPMGIALNGNRLSVGSQVSVTDYYNMPEIAERIESTQTHTACYIPRDIHVTGNIDVHEMAFDQQDELWIINTKMSCLCTLDKLHSFLPQWKPPFISVYDPGDRCHLNGLAMRQGQPFWVTALGVSDTPGGWREHKASGGVLIEVSSGRMLTQGLSMPHSPRWHNDRLWVLESGAGLLLEVNPENGETIPIAEMPGFCRGIDFAGRYAFIGLSQVRETAVFAGIPLTQRCAKRYCGVWVVDLEKQEVVGHTIFPDEIQEIFAIQIIPSVSPAILDMEDQLVESSYLIPEEAYSHVKSHDSDFDLNSQALKYFQAGEFERAAEKWQQLVASDPNQLLARFYLGVVLSDLKNWDHSISVLQEVIKREPHHAQAHYSLAKALVQKKRYKEALTHFELAISADQQYCFAHIAYGKLLLKLGEYQKGWEAYQWQMQLDSFQFPESNQPIWDGSMVEGQSLLVYIEDGWDKTLLFARFLPLVANRCATLNIACEDSYKSLIRGIEGVANVYSLHEIANIEHHFNCPMLLLGKVLGITLDNLPQVTPYLFLSESYNKLISSTNHKLKVGVAWKADMPAIFGRRTVSAEEMLKSEYYDRVDFIGLPSAPGAIGGEQVYWVDGIPNFEGDFRTYEEIGLMISQLDLVISACSNISYLAAALNVPAWAVIPNDSDWVWPVDQEASPWCPNIRKFGQENGEGWEAIAEALRHALDQLQISSVTDPAN